MSFYQFRGNQLIIVNVYRIGYVQGGNFLPPFLHNSFFGDFSHCYIEMHPQVCKRSRHDARVLRLTWVIDRTSITLLNYYFTYKINNFHCKNHIVTLYHVFAAFLAQSFHNEFGLCWQLGEWFGFTIARLYIYFLKHFSNLNLESQEDLLKTEGRSQQEGWGALHAPGT